MIKRERLQFNELAKEIVYQLPEELFISDKTLFLDPAFAGGQFLRVIVERLKEYNHSDDNINSRIYGIETKIILCDYIKETLKLGNYYSGDFLDKNECYVFQYHCLKEELSLSKEIYKTIKETKEQELKELMSNRKFDVIIGNPPYNINNIKTPNGTGGDVTLYKKFYNKSKTVLKKEGYLSLVVPKGIIKELEKEELDVISINLMTEKDYWEFNTCYFLLRNSKTDIQYEIKDEIISKLFVTYNPNWYENNGDINSNMMNYDGKEAIECIIKLPDKHNNEYELKTVNPDYSKIIPEGYKLCNYLFNSPHSWLVTDKPFVAKFGCAYLTETSNDAEKLKLFVLNNPIFKFFYKKMKLKREFWALRNLKPFDLSQLETGLEIPKEFNLTEKDLEIIYNS